MTTQEKAYLDMNGMSTPPAIQVFSTVDKQYHWHFGGDCCHVEVPYVGGIWIAMHELRVEALPDQSTVKYYKAGEGVPPWHWSLCEEGARLYGELLRLLDAAVMSGSMTDEKACDLRVRLCLMSHDATKARGKAAVDHTYGRQATKIETA